MPTRNIVLTDHQSNFVESLVTSGRYQNASEVLREGLRLMEHREDEATARLSYLKALTQVGLDDMVSDNFTRFDSAEVLNAHLLDLASRVASGA